ncbi:Z1 domain-containing protein [Parafrankia elaeagni]|uniref:Z1 domain-containing protein n=1 Tax=Parafrankia elaeagni TaxID=222534 RepID=UPI00035C1077|nr:Z1 domain-containing protein [Parafrankia elaeagni]
MSGGVVGLPPALNSMLDEAPAALLDTVNFFAVKRGASTCDERSLVAALTTQGSNDEIRVQFQILIARWDAVTGDDASWAQGTRHHTAERRAVVYRALGFAEPSWPAIEAVYPPDPAGVVIEARDKDWHHWYTAERRAGHDFYWKAYSGLLLARQGWSASALGRLDTATTAVIERLADPTWEERFQARGLVVGYVQSGKTANFTGVVAKAMDAGFRLVIVLTGTVEILRKQTQRRLDMELIGVENILGGVDEKDPAQFAETDYHEDTGWHEGHFLRHGVDIGNLDEVPAVHRLSTYSGDYKRLKQGLGVLDFRAQNQLKNKLVPLYRSENLLSSDVRIAVVKKNSTVLKKLVADLRVIRANLGEIPSLIIDDEADQASVNTRKPPTSQEKRERTAVNQQISQLLRVLSRAQYIGYTATPFANVFVDPDDSEDIFPKDFILALERPDGYMGATDFHDLGVDYGDQAKTIHNSNEKAYVRDLTASVDDEEFWRDEMQGALDAFVLSGAIKLYREAVSPRYRFRHHTMLVHESVKVVDHADLADRICELWRCSGYDGPSGTARLRKLFEGDFEPVIAALHGRAVARAESEGKEPPDALPAPATFDDLVGKIGSVLDRIETGRSPVIVVNGSKEKDYEQDELDFQAGDVWKILVGGTKLSRGFTVEGLTVSYYTRRTGQADSLMQMGRWFGFRRGYHDLVRLYIGRNVRIGNREYDLYEAFQATVEDEEDFRAELRRYSEPASDGSPRVRPEDVPPMVFQQLPWLKPTSGSKMYNAELVRQGAGGKVEDFTLLPDRGDGSSNAHNLTAIQPLLAALDRQAEFQYFDKDAGVGGKKGKYSAWFGVVSAQLVHDVMEQFRWLPSWDPRPRFAAVQELINDGSLRDFVVFVPLLKVVHKRLGDHPEPLPITTLGRRSGDRAGFNGSYRRQRDAMKTISGVLIDNPSGPGTVLDPSGGEEALALHTATRGALLLNFALDAAPAGPKKPEGLADPAPAGDIATLISYALPFLAKTKIGFKVKKRGAGAIIRRDAQQ